MQQTDPKYRAIKKDPRNADLPIRRVDSTKGKAKEIDGIPIRRIEDLMTTRGVRRADLAGGFARHERITPKRGGTR
jgi:hypothetical protein